MYAFDADGDGRNDIFSSSAHGIGIWWQKQEGDATNPTFKKHLLNKLRSEARYEAARIAKEIRDEAREVADRDATRIISLAIERSASEITGFRTVSVVKLPNEKLKGYLRMPLEKLRRWMGEQWAATKHCVKRAIGKS